MSDALPAVREDAAPVPVLAEAQLKRLRGMAHDVIETADALREELRAVCGPQPGAFAQGMITGVNMGAGYFRDLQTSIERLFRERNTALARKRKEQGDGA